MEIYLMTPSLVILILWHIQITTVVCVSELLYSISSSDIDSGGNYSY